MGNWRHRAHRRFYRQDTAPKYPPSYHRPETRLSELPNDGVPLWEKKFCTTVGKVSWRKIVDTNKFRSSNEYVFNWDDSAGKEAFHNAKSRYWAEINGLSCGISAPDPNAYIDEINWNPYIDPELVRELEKEYFAATDVEGDNMVGEENKIAKNLSSAPTEGCNMSPFKVDNPWESNNVTEDSSKDLLGWGHLVLKADDSRDLNSDGNNPWESSITQENGSGKHNSWGYNGSRDWNTGKSSWGCSYQGSKKDDGWGDFKRTSWERNQRDTKKLPNKDDSWKHNHVQRNVTPNDNRWGDCGRYGCKLGVNHDRGSRKLDFRNSSSGGAWHSGSRKREGSHQYIPGYKSSKFQPGDNLANHCWMNGKPNKRVSFARD